MELLGQRAWIFFMMGVAKLSSSFCFLYDSSLKIVFLVEKLIFSLCNSY